MVKERRGKTYDLEGFACHIWGGGKGSALWKAWGSRMVRYAS